MIHELNHFGIVVRDLEKSLAFYQGVLGAKIVYKGFIPPSKTDVIYLLITGGLIELLHPAEPKPDTAFGITHIAFMTDDLEGDYERLTASGIEGLSAPRPAGSGAGRLAFVRDPNGARVELIRRDLAMRDEPVEHPIIRSFDHYSMIANDLDAALDFYVGKLGMRELKRFQLSGDLTMVYLNYGYDVLELLHRPTPNTTDSMYKHFALRVDDVDAALEAFAGQGVPIVPGTPRPAGIGIGKVGAILDPDGVEIEVLDRPDLRDLQ